MCYRNIALLIVMTALLALGLLTAAPAATTARLSVAGGGAQANGYSDFPAISSDGRYVAFMSYAGNLVAGDNNGGPDVFWHDRLTGVTKRLSVTAAGTSVFAPSYAPTITANGQYVAFMSTSNELVPNDINIANDIFLRNCQTLNISLISVATSGAQGNEDSTEPSLSADGRYVAFTSLSTNLVSADLAVPGQIYVRDLAAGVTTRVSRSTAGEAGNQGSRYPSISPDGRYVTFQSDATNLATADRNNRTDIFVHDRATGSTTRVSVSSSGEEAHNSSYMPCISRGGRYVAFHSYATGLVPGDTNGQADVFVRDRFSNQMTRVSVNETGGQGAFESVNAAITPDGRYVAFGSDSSLVTGDTNLSQDVFVRDRIAGTTTRVSLSTAGAQGNAASGNPAISATAKCVAFVSDASTLVTGDTNGVYDIFLRNNNNAPTLPTSVTISPFAPGPETLTATAKGTTDADGDPLSFQYQWSKKNPDGTWGIWGYTARSLLGYNLKIGDVWRVRSRAYDNTEYSLWKIGSSATIVSMAYYSPKAGTAKVPTNAAVYLDFRWIPVKSTVTSRVLLKQGTTVVPVTMSWVNDKTLKLTPKAPLRPGKYYRVYVSRGIECTSGRVLTWDESQAYFVTAPLVAPAALSVAAAPTAAGAEVSVNLSAAATVRTVICNIAGRVVAELPERDLPAGVSSLVWNGKGNSGTRVPSGSYLVRVEAKGEEGTQAAAVGALQMR